MAIAIAIEDPLRDDVRALIAELNAALDELTRCGQGYRLTVEQLAELSTTVLVVRDDGLAIACGALRRHGSVGEIKRMYTRPAYRGCGIGGRVVAKIEDIARSDGLKELVLETGDGLEAAGRVYESAGFTRCGPVLQYPDTGWSIFYCKSLGVPESVAA
jgi:putative acetyltransferase